MKSNCKIKIGFLALVMFLSLLITSLDNFFILFTAVAVHELGHILMAKFCNIRLRELKLGIFGAALTPTSTLYSYKKEILLALGGPLFSFACTFAVRAFSSGGASTDTFAAVSLMLGCINLLPIAGFDGGRITHCILCVVLGPRSAGRILKLLSFTFIFILWLCSVYLLIKLGVSLNLFIFSLSLFTKIFIPNQT